MGRSRIPIRERRGKLNQPSGTKERLMNLQEEYRHNIATEVEVQSARLAVLSAKIERADSEGRGIARAKLTVAEQKLAALRTGLFKLSEDNQSAWETLKGEVEDAWSQLAVACRKATEAVLHLHPSNPTRLRLAQQPWSVSSHSDGIPVAH